MLALGLEIGDPITGMVITVVILRITWQSFRTVQRNPGTGRDVHDDDARQSPGAHCHLHPDEQLARARP